MSKEWILDWISVPLLSRPTEHVSNDTNFCEETLKNYRFIQRHTLVYKEIQFRLTKHSLLEIKAFHACLSIFTVIQLKHWQHTHTQKTQRKKSAKKMRFNLKLSYSSIDSNFVCFYKKNRMQSLFRLNNNECIAFQLIRK